MVTCGVLSPRRCEVFEQDLLYLFYGRPAFRRSEGKQVRQTAKAPVVLLLSPDTANRGVRMFPFDSGAFSGRYDDWVHRGMKLQDFEMQCSLEAAQRHVQAFYSNNMHYVRMAPRTPSFSYIGDFEVEALVHMLADPSVNAADDRRLAIELQLDESVSLSSPSVIGVILPDELTHATWVRPFLQSNPEVEVLTYELSSLHTAGHYLALLEERAVNLQARRGWL